MSNDSIKLSKKHGVNPTMGACFFCGEPTGELALLGELPNDAQAPKYMVLNYNPCKECQEKFNEGVLVVEVTQEKLKTQPPITEGHTPTGRYVVLKPEVTKYKKGDKCLMLDKEFEHLFSSIINN